MATLSSILAWRIPWTGILAATVHWIAELDTTKQLNTFNFFDFLGGRGSAFTYLFV